MKKVRDDKDLEGTRCSYVLSMTPSVVFVFNTIFEKRTLNKTMV